MYRVSLRAARVTSGYSIKAVSEQCGVSIKLLRKYEKDPSGLPLYLIIQLSNLYKIDPVALLRSI